MIVIEPLGSHNLLTVKTGDDLLKVSTPPHLFPQLDSSIWLRLEARPDSLDGCRERTRDPACARVRGRTRRRVRAAVVLA